MTREEAEAFAEDWAAAFNNRDVERILNLYDDDVLFISPRAAAVVGESAVRGKQALRAYWNHALSYVDSLTFVIDRVLWDATAQELVIVYLSDINGNKQQVSENLRFGPNGLIVQTEVFHGVAQ